MLVGDSCGTRKLTLCRGRLVGGQHYWENAELYCAVLGVVVEADTWVQCYSTTHFSCAIHFII